MELAMLGIEKKKKEFWIDAYKRCEIAEPAIERSHAYTHTHKEKETLNKKWKKICFNDTHNQHSTLSHSFTKC